MEDESSYKVYAFERVLIHFQQETISRSSAYLVLGNIPSYHTKKLSIFVADICA